MYLVHNMLNLFKFICNTLISHHEDALYLPIVITLQYSMRNELKCVINVNCFLLLFGANYLQ